MEGDRARQGPSTYGPDGLVLFEAAIPQPVRSAFVVPEHCKVKGLPAVAARFENEIHQAIVLCEDVVVAVDVTPYDATGVLSEPMLGHPLAQLWNDVLHMLICVSSGGIEKTIETFYRFGPDCFAQAPIAHAATSKLPPFSLLYHQCGDQAHDCRAGLRDGSLQSAPLSRARNLCPVSLTSMAGDSDANGVDICYSAVRW